MFMSIIHSIDSPDCQANYLFHGTSGSIPLSALAGLDTSGPESHVAFVVVFAVSFR